MMQNEPKKCIQADSSGFITEGKQVYILAKTYFIEYVS